MKKAYVTPTAEKLEFQYEKVVAAFSGKCGSTWSNIVVSICTDNEYVQNYS